MKKLINKILNLFKPKSKINYHYDPLAIEDDVYPLLTPEERKKYLDKQWNNALLLLDEQSRKMWLEELNYRERYDIFIDITKK